jgi:hypothetical protein
MAQLITNLEALAVFEALLLGTHTPTDANRISAQQQVRTLCQDRVYRGRKPQDNTRKDTILLRFTSNLPELLLSGEDDCTTSTVTVQCLSQSDYRASLLSEGVRQLVTTFSDTVTTPAGDVIAQIFPEDKDAPEPEPPSDGSPWFEFEYIAVYRVVHTIVSPAGTR